MNARLMAGLGVIAGFGIAFSNGEAVAAEQMKLGRTACWVETVFDNLWLNRYNCPYPSGPGPDSVTVDRVVVYSTGGSSTNQAKLCVRYSGGGVPGLECGAPLTLSGVATTFSTSTQMSAWQNNPNDFAYVWVKVAQSVEFKGYVAVAD